jgi:hypothetical protein
MTVAENQTSGGAAATGRFPRLLDCARRLLEWIFSQTFPIVECWSFKRKHTPRLVAAEDSGELAEKYRGYLDVERDKLEQSHQIELRRRAVVQQRVQQNAAVATVIGFLGAGLALVGKDSFKDSDSLLSVLRVLLTFAVAWLVMSGLSAIQAIGIQRQFDHWLQTRDVGPPREATDIAQRTTLVKMILLNQGYTLIVTNYAMASHMSMRNAFFAMGAIVLAIVWMG